MFGVGVDVVRTPRLRATYNRFGLRFLRRAYGPSEIEEFFRRGGVNVGGEEAEARVEAAAAGGRLTVRQVEFLASRWAIKEACHKALGNWRLPFPEIVLHSRESDDGSSQYMMGVDGAHGRGAGGAIAERLEQAFYRKDARTPCIRFEESALQVVETLGISRAHASISHDGDYAFAAVVLESSKGQNIGGKIDCRRDPSNASSP